MEAITREEKLMDGQTLEPITRKEKILAGEDLETITREEYFLKKYRGGGGGDITVESLNVTENGTYQEESKAYSPVVVNVPTPENSYQLKSLPTGAISTIEDGSALPMPSLKVGIEAVQSGSGDPSPTNIRPISGWSAVNVNVCGGNVWDEEWELGLINSNNGSDYPSNNNIRSKYIPIKSGNYYFKTPQNSFIFGYDKNKNYIGRVAGSGAYKNALMTITDTNCAFIRFYVDSSYGTTYNNDISINYPSTDTEYHAYNGHTYNIPFTDAQGNPIEVYGGSVDVVNGTSENKKIYDIVVFDGSEDEAITLYNANSGGFWLGTIDSMKDYLLVSQNPPFVSDYLKTVSQSSAWTSGVISEDRNTKRILACLSNFGTSVEECRQYLSQHPLTIRYELATPTTFYTQPTSIKSLLGTNNLWADSGDVLEGSYFKSLN